VIVDLAAVALEKFPELGRAARPVVLAIQFQPNATARREMFAQIVEEELPLGHAPQVAAFVIVEANHKRGDEIELFAKIGQGNKRLNLMSDAPDAEEARDVGEHDNVIDVEPGDIVIEQLRDVGEISGAATKIENALRGRCVQLETADAANVDVDPTLKIEILRPIFAGIINRVFISNPLECFSIDGLNYLIGPERKLRA
jgi:hypothetical protein